MDQMKGTEVDNRRRFAQLSPKAKKERELAKLIREDRVELTPNGELRTKPAQGVATVTQAPAHKLPDETWE
jgi:hypothetical protein